MRTLTTPLSALTLAAALSLAACASGPKPVPSELQAARAAVQQARSDPAVLAAAPTQLQQANEALSRAESLHRDGESLAEIASASYVAQRQAEAAQQQAEQRRNEQAMRDAAVERERLRAELEAAKARQARERAAAAEGQANAARVQAAMAGQQARTAEMRARLAEADVERAREQLGALQDRLQQVQALQTDRGMLVTLGDVLFEFNRAEVKPAARGDLERLAAFLREHPERTVLIEGYTDSVGSASYNLQLSQQRAQAVARELAAMGVPMARIATAGYGKDYPVADNASDTERAMNRRVEVYISNGSAPVRPRQG